MLVLRILAMLFALFMIFIMVIYLEVDIKMTLRYRRGPKTQVRIIKEAGDREFSNYGVLQKSNKYIVYEAEYFVDGQRTGLLYTKDRHSEGEILEAPYWIENDGSIELTPRMYMDRLVKMLISALIAIPWIVGCILYKIYF